MDEKELEALKAANPKAYEFIMTQKADLDKFKAAPPKNDEPKKDDPANDPDLKAKAAAAAADADKAKAREKQLESSIAFSMKSPEFLKQHGELLPKDVADIFAQAEKEKFGDAIEKDQAIKSGLIQSFFSVQANVELLTPAQKSALDEYLKLTKTGKQEKAQNIYDMIFEPAFERLKSERRAAALARGHGGGGGDDDYKKRMLAAGRKHYLGEKE